MYLINALLPAEKDVVGSVEKQKPTKKGRRQKETMGDASILEGVSWL